MTDLDRLTRAQLPDVPRRLAGVLDDWLLRLHGVTSSHHGVGLLLDLLGEAELQVVDSPVSDSPGNAPCPCGPCRTREGLAPRTSPPSDLVTIVGPPWVDVGDGGAGAP